MRHGPKLQALRCCTAGLGGQPATRGHLPERHSEVRGGPQSIPVAVPTKAEGDAEEAVIDVGPVRAAMHNDAPAHEATGVVVPAGRADAAARQAVPAERRGVQDVAVVVEGSLHNAGPAVTASQR